MRKAIAKVYSGDTLCETLLMVGDGSYRLFGMTVSTYGIHTNHGILPSSCDFRVVIEPLEETIELNGKNYIKADVEAALEKLKPVEEK